MINEQCMLIGITDRYLIGVCFLLNKVLLECLYNVCTFMAEF